MPRRSYASTRAVVAAVRCVVERHAILAVIFLGRGRLLRRRLHVSARRLHFGIRQAELIYTEEVEWSKVKRLDW